MLLLWKGVSSWLALEVLLLSFGFTARSFTCGCDVRRNIVHFKT